MATTEILLKNRKEQRNKLCTKKMGEVQSNVIDLKWARPRNKVYPVWFYLYNIFWKATILTEQINSSLRWGHEEGQKCFYSHEKEVKGDGYINYLDCDSGISGVYAVPTC